MGFIDNHLMTDEHIVYRAKLHWIIFIKPFFLLFICLFFLIPGLSLLPDGLMVELPSEILDFRIYGLDVVRLLGLGIGIFAAFPVCLSGFIRFKSSEYGVSNKRVLIKEGFIRRNSFETLLMKVEGIAVDQSIPGRVFNFGTIVITGTGGSKEIFHRISNPLEFRKQVQEQISK